MFGTPTCRRCYVDIVERNYVVDGCHIFCSPNCVKTDNVESLVGIISNYAKTNRLGSPEGRRYLSELHKLVDTLVPTGERPRCEECWMPMQTGYPDPSKLKCPYGHQPAESRGEP